MSVGPRLKQVTRHFARTVVFNDRRKETQLVDLIEVKVVKHLDVPTTAAWLALTTGCSHFHLPEEVS